ncbi:OmpP1/FadL family transporter [Plebeiibacterium sediminum]|uniref:Outer membrane protein transport protein n=1 Tax=Plebeiibacterium sediminum TaxID=2992112 RepID=A0AAE3SG46_9BACT|nr:outer membrane protein transport protein [Plebeiobacterium sediminum]MCW3788115.1 outer membrane protein transport protein [Plebeiobacterium sediminum]
MKNIYLAILVLLFLSSPTYATDGYFGVGYGAQNKGLAGAGIAWYKNSLLNGNPAGHVLLGKKYQIGVGFFNPNRQYTVTGNPSMKPGTFGLMPGTVESDSKLFLMPSMGANWMINEQSSFSATLFGNGGMNTDYPPSDMGGTKMGTFGAPGRTGVNLAQMFVGLTYSRKIAEKHSLGVTALLAYQYFEAKGLIGFSQMSRNPSKLTDNGTDGSFGYGIKIGYMGEIIDGLTLGASYQSKLLMGEFDDYAGLFAEQGDFDIPSTWTVGLAYEITNNWAVMADYKMINYSDVAAVSNKMNVMTTMLGDDNGSGFGWEDISVIKIGTEYSGIENWTLRAGYSHCEQPIPSSEVMFNILAPGVIENHITIGCSKYFGESGKGIHASIVYAPSTTVKGDNPLDFEFDNTGNPVGYNQTIELEMNQFELEIAFTF